jgi:DNA-binding YbaB/EbfC family protein
MKDFSKMMKQVQKMQSEMMERGQKLQTMEYEATSGGGMVVAKVNGKMELVSLKIQKACIDPEDPDMMQDLVKAAVNEAIRKAREDAEKSLQSLGAGMNLPGMPF